MRIINLKEHILSTAKDIATKEGIDKLNVRRVAKESGVAIGTIYNYYPSKGDIVTAVIEDFWKNAFAGINFSILDELDIIDRTEMLYLHLLNYLNNFKESWMNQLSLMSIDDKSIGRKKEKEYLNKIHLMIALWLDEDESAAKNLSTDEKRKLAEFIFENILTMLKKDEQDFSFFKKILIKILD